MTFLTVLVASALGQLLSLWVVGTIAHRQNVKKAEAIQSAFQEALKEVEEKEKKMREYARMES